MITMSPSLILSKTNTKSTNILKHKYPTIQAEHHHTLSTGNGSTHPQYHTATIISMASIAAGHNQAQLIRSVIARFQPQQVELTR